MNLQSTTQNRFDRIGERPDFSLSSVGDYARIVLTNVADIFALMKAYEDNLLLGKSPNQSNPADCMEGAVRGRLFGSLHAIYKVRDQLHQGDVSQAADVFMSLLGITESVRADFHNKRTDVLWLDQGLNKVIYLGDVHEVEQGLKIIVSWQNSRTIESTRATAA